MGLITKITKTISERPTYIYPYSRQTIKFYLTRLLYRIFRPKGIELGRNVRIQSFSSLRAQLPDSRIIIGDNSLIWEGCRFEAVGGGEIEIGKYAQIVDSIIFSKSKIKLGDNVAIGQFTYIQDCLGHPIDPKARRRQMADQLERFFPSFDHHKKPEGEAHVYDLDPKPIILEDNIIIYRNCVIGRGVTIGENSVIAANSVVTRDIPSNSFAAGNPAVVKKEI